MATLIPPQHLLQDCHAVFSGATQSNRMVSVMRVALSRRDVRLHDGYHPLRELADH